VRFQLLGPLEVTTEQGPIDLGPPKQRSVLAVLLLNANEIVSTDRIIDSVWGDNPPRTAGHSVQIYISDLRKALAEGSQNNIIETRPPGYVLNVPPEQVDALRFERLVREGLVAVRNGDVAGGWPKLERALDEWTAAPLSDFTYASFAQGHIRSLEEMRSDALEALGAIHLEQGDTDRAREIVRIAIAADPLREEPRRLMMLALYRSGRQAEALRRFGEYQTLLAEELGIQPSEALRDLEERVLLQDPTLDLQAPSTSEGNPYRGLRAFSEEDSEVYFGREDLVAEVLDRLENGPGFVSIVGPSGSGKSSAARAGVIPAVRRKGVDVCVFQPGSRPLWELAGALDRVGLGSRASLLRRFESDAGALSEVVTRPLVMIIDQFEEVFTLAEKDAGVRLSELLASAVRDHQAPLKVVVTLRADYYDKPLSLPSLAGVFSDSVVSVKPMTPLEIERAVVKPAKASGTAVEPALVAQLVADMGDEPGALPLLQFTLFELYERTSNGLTLADYQRLGGINGALTGGADDLLRELDPAGRELAEQLMMRMVQKGRALSTSRPVPVRDLIDLGMDPVDLQNVLEVFGSRRLVTFDRDASGAAVVEMAHEFLITQWPQMETWLKVHSEDLDRLYVLEVATADWLGAGRSDDYLLRGERLDHFEGWRAETTIMLTKTEADFVNASVALRDRESEAEAEREAQSAALQKQARRRLGYLGVAVAALAAAVTLLVMTLIPEPPPDVVVWFDGRGDGSFGDLIGAGIDLASETNPSLTIVEYTTPAQQFREIQRVIDDGVPLVIWENQKIEAFDEGPFVEGHPETHFVFLDCAPETVERVSQFANGSCIITKNEEIGFLAGVAAASVTTQGRVGFLGGLSFPIIWNFQAGFEQGVAFVDDSVEVDAIYLTSDFDFSGFISKTMGSAASEYLMSRGSDVIFHAAGHSGWGMFESLTRHETDIWGIGVDVDQYQQIEVLGFFNEEEVDLIRGRMLTSVVKRLDLGIAEAIDQFASTGDVGHVFVSIATGGVQHTTTGGHITPWSAELDAAIEAVRSGQVSIDPEDFSEAVLLFDELLP
jgi:DNA-binding SARP family transcriptional activator/basic membrane lipoprotein Med (substrate-binding protein (PBP1-ABC) superfamily)